MDVGETISRHDGGMCTKKLKESKISSSIGKEEFREVQRKVQCVVRNIEKEGSYTYM